MTELLVQETPKQIFSKKLSQICEQIVVKGGRQDVPENISIGLRTYRV